MATPKPGMFGSWFPSIDQQMKDEAAEERSLQWQSENPLRANAYAANRFARDAGEGLARAGAALMGKDTVTPQEHRQAAMQKAGQELAQIGDVDLSDEGAVNKYYKGVIDVLRRNNLPGEAHAAAQEWQMKIKEARDAKLKQAEIDRKTAADQLKAKGVEESNRIKAQRNADLAKMGMPHIAQLIDAAEKQTNPAYKQAMIDRINREAKGKLTVTNAGDEMIVRNELGEIVGVDEVGLNPNTTARRGAKDKEAKEAALGGYAEYIAGLQRHYDAAVELYNHPGLPGILGRFGRWKGEPGPLSTMLTVLPGLTSDAALAALGKYDQVAGGAFLAGLAKLKAASKTGATGLGAVSEKEGDKVQADAAALNRYQQPADFRASLQTYLHWIEGHAQRAAQEAANDANALGVATPATGFQERALTVPRGQGGKPTGAPLRSRDGDQPSPNNSPAVPSGAVWMLHPKTGKRMPIKADKVEEAKRRGFKETQ
jgi:hypothetical protein